MDTSKLKKFFFGLKKEDREPFAIECGTSEGQINQIIYGHRSCSAALAIELEKHSKGEIICDELCPNTDFSYLRNQSHQLAG